MASVRELIEAGQPPHENERALVVLDEATEAELELSFYDYQQGRFIAPHGLTNEPHFFSASLVRKGGKHGYLVGPEVTRSLGTVLLSGLRPATNLLVTYQAMSARTGRSSMGQPSTFHCRNRSRTPGRALWPEAIVVLAAMQMELKVPARMAPEGATIVSWRPRRPNLNQRPRERLSARAGSHSRQAFW